MVQVFSTIFENIRSFFNREEELLQDPKPAPESADEVFSGKNSANNSQQGHNTIVQKHLDAGTSSDTQQQPSSQTTSKPLPSPDDLRSALAKKQPVTQQKNSLDDDSVTSVSKTRDELTRKASPDHELSSEDLQAFEETFAQIAPQTTQNTQEGELRPKTSRPASVSAEALRDGFFSSFEQYLQKGPDAMPLKGDLLHKMRSFHEQRHEGKEVLLHEDTAQDAIRRRLRELQSLEHEWQVRYNQSRELERTMMHLEEEIDERTKALQTLLDDAKKLHLLSKECSSNQAFVFSNGAKARSISALLRVLRLHPRLFSEHVRSDRNDFAAWVESVFGNVELATSMRTRTSYDSFMQLFSKQYE